MRECAIFGSIEVRFAVVVEAAFTQRNDFWVVEEGGQMSRGGVVLLCDVAGVDSDGGEEVGMLLCEGDGAERTLGGG